MKPFDSRLINIIQVDLRLFYSRVDQTELIAALVVICSGFAAIWAGHEYQTGTLARIGPGFFPLVLGGGLLIVGALMLAKAGKTGAEKTERAPLERRPANKAASSEDASNGEPLSGGASGTEPLIEAPLEENLLNVSSWLSRYRGLLLTFCGLIAFFIAAQTLGFVAASFLLIFISALGHRRNGVKTAVVMAVVITLMAVLIFHVGLQIQFPLFVWK